MVCCERFHYTASVSKTLSRFRQTLTLCYNEQTPNPCRWVWLTVVLANVKNKSSWIDLYIWVWDSRKKIRDHFSASLGYHFSSSEPTPKVEQQRQYFCRAEQSKTPLGRCRRPFVKISSHENMGSSQKVAKTRFFAWFSRLCQKSYLRYSREVKLRKQGRAKQQTGHKTTYGSSDESPITYSSVAYVSNHTDCLRKSFFDFLAKNTFLADFFSHSRTSQWGDRTLIMIQHNDTLPQLLFRF